MVLHKLPHLDVMRGGKTLRYRRRWPKDVAHLADSAALIVYMKNKSGVEMIKEHAALTSMFDQTVAELRARNEGKDERSAAQRFHEAALVAAGMINEARGFEDDEQALRGHLVKGLQGRNDIDPEVIEQLRDPNREQPPVTLIDGVRLYRQMRVKDDRAKATRLDRAVQRMTDVWGKLDEFPIEDLKRVHGRDMLQALVDHRKPDGSPLAPDSIKREFGQISAIIALAIRENDLAGKVANPLEGVELPKDNRRASAKRMPMSDEAYVKVADRLRGLNDNPALWPIWSILSLGVHAKEACFLERQDIDLDRGIIHIRSNDLRGGLKTDSRDRDVPVTKNVKAAIQAAMNVDPEGASTDAVFPRYSKGPRSADTLTQLLNTKHLKPLGIKETTYSLRHRASSKLRAAGAEQAVIDRILGHSIRGVGASVYGGDEKVEQARAWMNKAGL